MHYRRNDSQYLHKPWILTHYFSLFPFKVRKKKIYINFIAAIAIAKLGFFFKSQNIRNVPDFSYQDAVQIC